MTSRLLQLCLAAVLQFLSITTVDAQELLPWSDSAYPEYHGAPWVRNLSRPYPIANGLEGRHISLWASHGRYYNQTEEKWKWQRPQLFGTCEDLFTQTIVVPYLIPMLEHAGAIVYMPRERDWQSHEVIVDNDADNGYHEEHGSWRRAPKAGFAQHSGTYNDGENPFEAGTARQIKSSRHGHGAVSWQPNLPEAGRYAVYVSYQTVDQSVPDAHYIVFHNGEQTHFVVNQQMGGSTWVYLGTFDFSSGSSSENCVVLTNESGTRHGIITADAVRFGGGMGNIQRGGTTSGLPRCDEGSRYWAQWAGMPYHVYSSKNGTDDYSDDINVRSLTTNYLSGGSIFNPAQEGLNVPLELALAFHSDAGKSSDIVGSLAISTTDYNDGKLATGFTRDISHTLAQELLDGVTRDMRSRFGTWNRRYLWDRNYSETRIPEIPSAILEMLSHENFKDMQYGHDPEFKFWLARSIYKTILRYLCRLHGSVATVQPLAPQMFATEFVSGNQLRLSWQPAFDSQEPSSAPTAYVLYTAKGNGNFDNGQIVNGTACTMMLDRDQLYRFRISAINAGGESFLSEELSAVFHDDNAPSVMIVNGFHRLSAPAVGSSSFNFDEDAGLSLGTTAAWTRHTFLAGNTQDYVSCHARAIADAGLYNIASCQSQNFEHSGINPKDYALIDLVLGNERNDGHSLRRGKAFSDDMRYQLSRYQERGGKLIISGSYVSTDLTTDDERRWLGEILHIAAPHSSEMGADSVIVYTELPRSEWHTTANDSIRGMSQLLTIYNQPNAHHYCSQRSDRLQGINGAFPLLLYNDGSTAAIAHQHVVVLGFPFECIIGERERNGTIKALISYLLPETEISLAQDLQ